MGSKGWQARAHHLKTAEEIRAVGTPLRYRIVQIVAEDGPCTVAHVADVMDRKVTTLYRHVHELVDAGVLVDAGSQGDGRERQALYRTRGWPVLMRYDPDDEQVAGAIADATCSSLRLLQRQLRDRLHSGAARTTGPERDTHAARVEGWLNHDEIRDLNRRIDELFEFVNGCRKRTGTLQMTLVVGMHPSSGPDDDQH